VSRTWHILGAGAIGSLFACKLQRAGIPVCLLLRAGTTQPSNPVVLIEGEQRHELAIEQAATDALEADSVEGLIITTKANQAGAAFNEIASKLQAGAPVVLLHNGMGVYEQLSAEHPTVDLYCGTTTEGGWLDTSRSLVHAGAGDTFIGQPGRTTAPDWFDSFKDSGERFYWEPEIERSLWRKLMINCAINPLTAIHRCRNGALLQEPDLQQEAQALCAELAAVTRARGDVELADRIRDEAFAVMASTAANQSSMLQDVQRGRETEIEYITGYFCREAERLGVPCPCNEALLQKLRQLDSQAPAT
jgi:2-dehydropantoate 2-reductase